MKTMRLGMAMAICATAALLGAGPAAAADAPIHGTVTDTGGHPLEGIEVCATLLVPPHPYSVCRRTDSLGQYTLLPATSSNAWIVDFYSPENEAPGYAPQRYVGDGAEPPYVTEAQREAGVDAVMQPGVEVRGIVIGSENEAPVDGVDACPVPQAAPFVRFCDTTDARGEFVLRGLGGGETPIRLITAGDVNYVDTSYTTPALSPGETVDPYIRMDRGVELSGVVTDAATGVGIEGPRAAVFGPVHICAVDLLTGSQVKCTTPGAGGSYSLPGIPAERAFAVSFAGNEYLEGLEGRSGHGDDGYVQQFWRCASTTAAATPLTAMSGVALTGIDAALLQGSDGSTPCQESAVPSGGGATGSQAQGTTTTTPPVAAPVLKPKPKPVRCNKGFRKVTKGGHARCVKIQKKKARHHRHAHRAHR